jgi:hypothetical protein
MTAAPSDEERAALARRLAARRAAARGTTIPRHAPTQDVPITPAQARLWFLEQLRPGTSAWNSPVAVRLRGPLEVEALRCALELLVERHRTLRTVFPAPGGRPAPRVLDVPRLDLPLAQGREEDVQRFVDAEVARPFDLEHDLMLRGRLLRVDSDDHVLVLVAHHIACDGWSKGILLDELGEAYGATRDGRPPSLPELPIDYADYAQWQQERLSGEALERLTSYWRTRLVGAAPALALPTDHPRPARQAFEGAVVWLGISPAVAGALLELGREERATPFMTLLAAFNALLFAYTGESDILVGSPSAMRTLPELERLVGLFANTLVYRTSLEGPPSFRELVRRVRDTAIGVYEHQDLPFEQIVQAVQPPRDLSRNPLVQVNLRVHGQEPELRLPGIEGERLAVDPHIARFDLAIELSAEAGGGYAGYLEYDAALFDATTARRIAEDFSATLDAVVRAPDAAIPSP